MKKRTGSIQDLLENTPSCANPSLEKAKQEALRIDQAARKDVVDVADFLANIGLSEYVSHFVQAGICDLISLLKFPEARYGELGLNLGEKIRLRRSVDVRKGMKDSVFGQE